MCIKSILNFLLILFIPCFPCKIFSEKYKKNINHMICASFKKEITIALAGHSLNALTYYEYLSSTIINDVLRTPNSHILLLTRDQNTTNFYYNGNPKTSYSMSSNTITRAHKPNDATSKTPTFKRLLHNHGSN